MRKAKCVGPARPTPEVRGVCLALVAACAWLTGPAPSTADACEGTPRPVCSRTAWVACSVDESVVHPGAGQDIVVPIRVYPYVVWNTQTACAQPSSYVLAMEVTCQPVDGGQPVDLGVFQISTTVPTAPGLQAVGGGVGDPFLLTIPADTLPPDKDYCCEFRIQLSVTFGAGIGSGLIAVEKKGKFCIVRPSSVDAAQPALEFRRLLAAGSDGLLRCRRGDMGVMHYLLANNETSLGVTLDLEALSDQVARMPVAAKTDKLVFAIASKKKKTDNFPLEFADFNDFGVILPEGNPKKKDDQRIKRQYYVGPGEIRLVSILVRTHGMCADGSCCNVPVTLEGIWDDGSPALGCAGAAVMVDDVPAKTPLYEITDDVKVDDFFDAKWSKAKYDGDPLLTTLAEGNLAKSEGGPGTQTTGSNLPPAPGQPTFPNAAMDLLRVEHPPNKVKYSFDVFAQANPGSQDPFVKTTTKVTIVNFAESAGPCAIPFIYEPGKARKFAITLDAAAGTVVFKDAKKGKKLFEGTLADLIATQAAALGLSVDEDTCRTIALLPPPSNYLCARPQRHATVFAAGSTPADDSAEIVNPLTDSGIAWTALSDNAAVSVPASGNAGDPLTITYSEPDTALFPPAMSGDPLTSVTWVEISGGFNDPYRMPVVSRRIAGLQAPSALQIDTVSGSVRLLTQKRKDTLKLTGIIPVTPGMQLQGEQVSLRLLDVDYAFTLTKKGKGKGGPKGSSFQLKMPKQGTDATWTLKLKKQDLSGLLSELGIDQHSTLLVDIPVALPVHARFFGSAMSYEGLADMLVFISQKKNKTVAKIKDA